MRSTGDCGWRAREKVTGLYSIHSAAYSLTMESTPAATAINGILHTLNHELHALSALSRCVRSPHRRSLRNLTPRTADARLGTRRSVP